MQQRFFIFISFFSLLFLSAGCASLNNRGPEQFAAIVGSPIEFETKACQLQSKEIIYRNTNNDKPQVINGIYFEGGTNESNKFRIQRATIGDSQEFPAVGNVISGDQDLVVPAGGILKINVSYITRKTTNAKKGEVDTSVVDLFLRDPALGVFQFQLKGTAPEALEGCGDRGTAQTFKVSQITITMKDKDIPGSQLVTVIPSTDIKSPLTFYVDNNGKATIDGASGEFPQFNIPAPGVIEGGVPINLASDFYEGTFAQNKDLDFPKVDFVAKGLLTVPAVQMTTGNVTVTAPDVLKNDGTADSISLSGSPFDGNKMTVVFAAPLPNNDNLKQLNGGAIGVKMELVKQ